MQYCSYMNDNIKLQQYVKEIKDTQKTEILYVQLFGDALDFKLEDRGLNFGSDICDTKFMRGLIHRRMTYGCCAT